MSFSAGDCTLFAFSRDLRLADHHGLAAVARYGRIVPVLVIDPATETRLRVSPRRAAYYCAAVAALAADLEARGARLVVRRGRRGPVLRDLARRARASAVGWSRGYDADSIVADRELQSVVEEAGLRALPVHDAPAVPPDDDAPLTRRGDGYRAFIPYAARWRDIVPSPAVPVPAFAPSALPSEPLPEAAEFGAAGVVAPHVSEAAAAAKAERFVDGPAIGYAVGRNVPAVDGTSRLSSELSFGTLSARTVVRALHTRLRDPFLLAEEKLSLRLFLRSFAQRDFLLQLGWSTYALGAAPPQRRPSAVRRTSTHPALAAWRSGRTGFPLIDAGIGELHATGAMHPRIRAVAAAFLCFDLGLDWRIGRDEWDRWLEEDTPALATANWEWIAGVGADPAAYPRIYNPLKAARRFDPAGVYIRRWVPELALAPDRAIFDPYGRHAPDQLTLDLFGSSAYPAPVLDHDAAARAYLERYGRAARATE